MVQLKLRWGIDALWQQCWMKELANILMCQWVPSSEVKSLVIQVRGAPAWLELGGHPPWGQAPGLQSSVHMTVYQ